MNFPHPIKIEKILKQIPDNTCGSASASIVFEKFGLEYNPMFFVKEGKDGPANKDYSIEGSSIFGTAMSMAKTDLVDIEIFTDIDLDQEYNTAKDCEKKLIDEFKTLPNIKLSDSIDIDEIISRISETCVPILAFYRNGDKNAAHFSPLRGLNMGKFLMLPLRDNQGSCDCDKDEFVKNWWIDRNCILVTKR